MLKRSEPRVSRAVALFDNYDQPQISLPPPSLKGHQRSRTTVDVPAYQRTPSASPTRLSSLHPSALTSRDTSPVPWSCNNSVSADSPTPGAQRKARAGAASKITSWFDGTSEPVEIKLVPSQKKENSEPFYLLDRIEEFAHNSIASMDNLTQRPRKAESPNLSSANSSRFSFFRKSAAPQTKADPEELVSMDVREALLPDGSVAEFTAATFKNLQLNAESLLRRFQASYTDNLAALRKLTAEKMEQNDELEAERTRSEHLKAQLRDMADRSSDQETVIAILKAQLAELQPTVRMIGDEDEYAPQSHTRRVRTSDISSNGSFVDSDISSAVSVFSEADSIHTKATSVAASPKVKHARLYSPKVMPSPEIQPVWETTPVLIEQCQNCKGTSTSEAWDLVEMMKMENFGLKERITELESANDDALSFLSTLKM